MLILMIKKSTQLPYHRSTFWRPFFFCIIFQKRKDVVLSQSIETKRETVGSAVFTTLTGTVKGNEKRRRDFAPARRPENMRLHFSCSDRDAAT